MLQLHYELLQVVPMVLLYAVVLAYYVLCIVFLCSKVTWVQHLERSLIKLSFDVLFKDESLTRMKEEVLKQIGSPVHVPRSRRDCDCCSALLRASQIAFSTLPIMLVAMTVAAFWEQYIIYETDSECDPSDESLECFSNATGPLTCRAVMEVQSTSHTCYKLAFDIKIAAAVAGGVYTTSIAVNRLLANIFLDVRHTIAGPVGTLLVQGVVAGATTVGFLVYAARAIGNDQLVKVEKILLAFSISYRIIIFCLFPWFRIKPIKRPLRTDQGEESRGLVQDSDYDKDEYQWIPRWLKSKELSE